MWVFLCRVVRKLRYYLTFILSTPIASFLLLIFPFVKIRFICLFSDRIGHFSANTELLLCAIKEAKYDHSNKFLFYLNDGKLCNKQLYKMWKRELHFFRFNKVASQVDSLLSAVLKNKYELDVIKHFKSGHGCQDQHGYFRKYEPRLYFTNKEKTFCEVQLRKLGIPNGAPIVCLMVRDSAYLHQEFPDTDWSYHNYRDADIENYMKSAKFLAEQGYYVLRMGSIVEKEFCIDDERVIDYANSTCRSDVLDIYITSKCSFFISTATGLDGVAQIFRRPILFTDLMPMCGQLQYWYPCFCFITKLIVRINTRQLLNFDEINYTFSEQSHIARRLQENALEVLNNTEQEIFDAVKEMCLIVKNDQAIFDGKEQNELLNQFPACFISGASEFMPEKENIYVRMCDDFYQKYKQQLIG